jgi:putative acetyltransferase
VRIGLAGPLDATEREALVDLWVAAWKPTFPHIDFAARRPWFLDYLEELLSGGVVVLVCRLDDGAPAGFATVHPVSGSIDQLAVDPGHAGRGFGTALLAEAKRICPTGLTLSVNVANTRALALYARQGFVMTGEGHSANTGLPIRFMQWRPAQPDG